MHKKVLVILCAAVSGILVAGLTSLLLSRFLLSVSHYEIRGSAFTAPIRIVQLTDLHNSEFGEGNARLIRRVAEQQPDLILLTGDLINQTEARTDVAEELIRGLAEIAPVYLSYGNHEKAHERTFGTDLKSLFTAAGARVLDFDWEDVEVKGQTLRLGGLYGYCLPEKYEKTGEARKNECDYLRAFQDTENYTVLLCHLPLCWIRLGSLDSWKADCVLSGHDHGGQIRIPFVGGLWAPDQGWFPGRDCGLYWSKDQQRVMALSRGLGSLGRLPRLNNVPEILVLDLRPAE